MSPSTPERGLRVLHLAHGWPPTETAGAERYAAALHDAQARLGHTVDHFVPAHLGSSRRPRGFRATWDWPAAAEALTTRLARTGPDVVHVHHLIGLSFSCVSAARAAGAVVVVTMNDAWLACARGQLIDRAGQRCIGPQPSRCAACLAPALYAPLPASIAQRLPLRLAPVRDRAAALTRLLGEVDLLLAPSPHLPAALGWPHVHLPVPLLEPLSPAPPRPIGPVRLLFVGSLLPTKGPDLALDAFAHLPSGAATLTLVGPTLPYAGSTRWADALLTRARATPGVTVVGALPPDALPGVYADHDVLLFPSRWAEMSPFTLREARAVGLRIVSADVPGARSVLDDAVFVRPDDPGAWRAAVAAQVRLGQERLDPVELGEMGSHARAVIDAYRVALAGRGETRADTSRRMQRLRASSM